MESLFLNNSPELNAAGAYAVNFYSLGVPHTVVVDDYLPTQKVLDDQTWKMVPGTIFTKISEDGALWPSILEKAFAKFHGNYKHIVGGDPKNSANFLTGAPFDSLDIKN